MAGALAEFAKLKKHHGTTLPTILEEAFVEMQSSLEVEEFAEELAYVMSDSPSKPAAQPAVPMMVEPESSDQTPPPTGAVPQEQDIPRFVEPPKSYLPLLDRARYQQFSSLSVVWEVQTVLSLRDSTLR